MPSAQDFAFMGAVDLVLRGIQLMLQQASERNGDTLTSGQEIRDSVMQLIGTKDVFNKMLAEAYGGIDGFTQYCQDCRTILTRFLSKYEQDQQHTLDLLSFIESDHVFAVRVRYLTALRAAHMSAKGMDPTPEEVQDHLLYGFLCVLFATGENG